MKVSSKTELVSGSDWVFVAIQETQRMRGHLSQCLYYTPSLIYSYVLLTLSRRDFSHWQVKSSGVRQSKTLKGHIRRKRVKTAFINREIRQSYPELRDLHYISLLLFFSSKPVRAKSLQKWWLVLWCRNWVRVHLFYRIQRDHLWG